VLQNGVLSNAVPFTVETLQLTSVNPMSGAPGTSVTITGTGFGAMQAGGTVWLGSAAGQVSSWSDTQIVAVVASNTMTGVVRVQQNGTWSNTLAFTVPGAGPADHLAPHMINMAVGDTHTIQALSSSGQSLTGLTWTSSDPTIVSLSADNPPVLTAVAVGRVTISAGGASADVTVSPTLALGTVLWSNPGDGSGVYNIVPAVPSSSGVADVFAFQNDDLVQAITADGTLAWTADVSGARSVLPDFQGGLVVTRSNFGSGGGTIQKLDGITGQPYPAYTVDPAWSPGQTVVHPDGTVFSVQTLQNTDTNPDCASSDSATNCYAVVGIDPTMGAQKFRIPLEGKQDELAGPNSVIIAGDGYAYVSWAYRETWVDGNGQSWSNNHLKLLRAGTDGTYQKMTILDWTFAVSDWIPLWDVSIITNADTGVLLTWEDEETGNTSMTSHMALTSGSSVSVTAPPQIAQAQAISPVLQAQDGSFIGIVGVQQADYSTQQQMVAFDASGNIHWVVPGNWQPQIATADGGVIATQLDSNWNPIATVTFDQNGNATGQMASLAVESWRGNMYQLGSIDQVYRAAINWAKSLWAHIGGSPSGNGTAARPWEFKLVWQNNCSSAPWPCGFTLYPDNPSYLPNLAIDATSQAAAVKFAALAAFKKAFSRYPVNATEGAPNTGDNRANVVDGSSSQSGMERCGASNPFVVTNDSSIFYLANMEQAQWALPIVLTTLQDVQGALARSDLMKAIGTGIGNNAAHEVGHQFFLQGSGMDDSSTHTYNGQGCDGAAAPWVYGLGNIQWETVTDTAWKSALGTGWHR
jgi:hypothetical protein